MEKGIFSFKSFALCLLSLLSLSVIFSGNLFQVVPAKENIEDKFKESVNEYAKDSGKSFIEKFIDDIIDNGSKEETVPSVLSYLLVPGHYMDNVSNATTIDKNDNTVFDNNKSLCNVSKSQPQNLLNHNCDLPTMATEIAQKISSTFESYGIHNGERTPSQSIWGVPSGLPENTVPTDPNARTGKYTALELYGYNLQYVNYKGEWDDIQISTRDRVLSNYGFWARTRLEVDSIWNGAKGGFKAIVEKFDWNPIKYVSNIIDGTVSSVLWTAVDTSDYNIASSHAWTRPEFSKTLYNVYYLNSGEVSKKAQAEYLKQIKNILAEELGKEEYKQLKVFFDVDPDFAPKFSYNPNLTKQVPKIGKDGKQEKDKKGNLVYKKVKVTEEEQINNWYKNPDVESFLSNAQYALGNDCKLSKSGSEFTSCYSSAYDAKLQEILSSEENEGLVSKLAEDVTKNFDKKNVHTNPASGISHYICADEEGNPTATSIVNYKYVYTKENSGNSEYLTEGCSLVRPSIKGGYYGTGYSGENSNDTRWKQFNFVRKTKTNFTDGDSIFNGIAQLVTKLTVTVLGISYGNILTELNLDKIAEATITSFRDSLFYPLLTLAFALGGISIFINIIKTRTPTQGFKTLGLMMLTFASGVIILNNPGNLVKWVDEIPSKIDQFALSIMPNNASTKSDTLCSNSGGSLNNVRSLQCQIWKINIFNPWVYGQWGTSYENLDASDFNNTNGSLVGKGTVNMGNGHKVNNWALYQLEKTKSGTLTTDYYNSNTVSKALYKIVDLQFGPNNGAMSDSRYAKQWSGINGRSGYRVSSALTSIFLAIPIIGIAIAKIEVSFMFAILLMFLPLLFLYGILSPDKGRLKLIEYGQKMIGLIVKRVFLNLILSFTLYFIIIGTQLSSNYKNVLIFSLGIAWGTKLYWKDLINLFNVSAASSQAFISDKVGGLRQRFSEANILSQALNFRFQGLKTGIRDTAVGITMGGAAGVIQQVKDVNSVYRRTHNGKKNGYRTTAILEGMINGGSSGARRASNFVFNKERRNGFSLYDNLKDSYKAGRNDYINTFRLDDSKTARSIKQMSNFINASEKDAFDDRNMKQRIFQTEYSRLLGMAVDRKIPVDEENHTLDLSDLNSKLYNEDGTINTNFKDNRFDEEFLAQMNRVILASGQLSKAKERHLHFSNAKNKLDEIQRNDFTSDDPEMFKALKSFTVGQEKWIIDENGKKVKVQVTVQEASNAFVNNVNNLSDFNHDEDVKFALETVNKKVRIYTDKFLRVKDDYVDEVVYDEDVLTNPDYLDRLGQIGVLTEKYVKDKYSEFKENRQQEQEEEDNRDYFEKLEDEWDPLLIYKQKMANRQKEWDSQISTEPEENPHFGNRQESDLGEKSPLEMGPKGTKSASEKVIGDIKDNFLNKDKYDFNNSNRTEKEQIFLGEESIEITKNSAVDMSASKQLLETVQVNFDKNTVDDLTELISNQKIILEKEIPAFDKVESIVSRDSEEFILNKDTKNMFNELTEEEADIVVSEVAYQKILDDVFANTQKELLTITKQEIDEPEISITEIPVIKEYVEDEVEIGKDNIIQMEKESDLSKSDKKSIVIENLITVAVENDINPEEIKLSEAKINKIIETVETTDWEKVEEKTTIPKEEAPKKYYEKVIEKLDDNFKEKIANQNVQKVISSVRENSSLDKIRQNSVEEKILEKQVNKEILEKPKFKEIPVVEEVKAPEIIIEKVKTNSEQLNDLEKPKFQQNTSIKEEKKDEIFNQSVKLVNSINKDDTPIIEEKPKKVRKPLFKRKQKSVKEVKIPTEILSSPKSVIADVKQRSKSAGPVIIEKPKTKQNIEKLKKSIIEEESIEKTSKFRIPFNKGKDSNHKLPSRKELVKKKHKNTQANVEEIVSATEMLKLVNKFKKLNDKDEE